MLLTASRGACSSNTCFSATVSVGSLSGVELPCALTYSTSCGARCASASARRIARAACRPSGRGARVYAEVSGYGMTNDAHHMTAPRPDGRQAARAIRLALADAHLAPHEVAYVNAHGSSTPLNDPTETVALKQVFGEHAPRLAVSSTKGYYGHALGASGAFEAAITALALSRDWLPPTLNLAEPDAGCDLDYVPRTGRAAQVDVALSNSFGFGGINASLVLQRADA